MSRHARTRHVILGIAAAVAVVCAVAGLVLHGSAELGDFFAGFPPSTHDRAAEIDGAMAAAAVRRAWSSALFVVAGVAAFTAIGAYIALAWQPVPAKA